MANPEKKCEDHFSNSENFDPTPHLLTDIFEGFSNGEDVDTDYIELVLSLINDSQLETWIKSH